MLPRVPEPSSFTRISIGPKRIVLPSSSANSAERRAAGELVRQGKSPTVVEVADEARVSRTTAYRYFPSQEALLEWGALSSMVEADVRHLNELAAGPGTPEERLDAVVQYDHEMTLDKEPAFRAMLQASLAPQLNGDPETPRRPGHRFDWFTDALGPLRDRLGEEGFSRLIAALGLCTGIESLIVLRDIGDLDPAAAESVKRWVAQALLKQSLAESSAGSK